MSLTRARALFGLAGLLLAGSTAGQSVGVPLAPEYLSEPSRSAPEPAPQIGPESVSAEGRASVEPGERDGGSVRVLLKAPRETTLSSQMEGRIVETPLGLGEAFEKGDLLIRFDCENRESQLAISTAEKEKARKTFESKKKLRHLDAVSDLDVALARADLERARAQLRQSRNRVSNCEIRAPYKGRVVKVHANQYEVVSPSTELMDIVETGELKLQALVPSTWLVWLEEGHAFDVHVDELDESVSAEVEAIGSRVDPVSQTISIRARIVDPVPGLLPGMSGDAQFERPDG